MKIIRDIEFESKTINTIENTIKEHNQNNNKYIIFPIVILFIIIMKFIRIFLYYDYFKNSDFTTLKTNYFIFAFIILCIYLIFIFSNIFEISRYGINNKKNTKFAVISLILCIISILCLNYIAYTEEKIAIQFNNKIQNSISKNTTNSRNLFEEEYLKYKTNQEFKNGDKFYENKLAVVDRLEKNNFIYTRLYMNLTPVSYYYQNSNVDPMYYYSFLNIFSKVYLIYGIYFLVSKKKSEKSVTKEFYQSK